VVQTTTRSFLAVRTSALKALLSTCGALEMNFRTLIFILTMFRLTQPVHSSTQLCDHLLDVHITCSYVTAWSVYVDQLMSDHSTITTKLDLPFVSTLNWSVGFDAAGVPSTSESSYTTSKYLSFGFATTIWCKLTVHVLQLLKLEELTFHTSPERQL